MAQVGREPHGIEGMVMHGTVPETKSFVKERVQYRRLNSGPPDFYWVRLFWNDAP